MNPGSKDKSPKQKWAGAALRFEKTEPESPATGPKRGTWKKEASRRKIDPAAAPAVVPERPAQTNPLPEVPVCPVAEEDDTQQATPAPLQAEASRRVASGQIELPPVK